VPKELKIVRDQMGRRVAVPALPQRIISLVPSQTELLFDLGLREEIVGLTKFCVHPAKLVKQKPSVGGTKQFRFDVIDQLQPELIIGNKEENYQDGIELLAARYPVWMSDVENLTDALEMITRVGGLVGKAEAATSLAANIEHEFAVLPQSPRPYRTAYLIWQRPYMAAGSSTFINDMLRRLGLVNVFAGGDGRYPTLTAAQITAAEPELIMLSSEPFPFHEKHQSLFQSRFPKSRTKLVDGEMFSWYGSRLLQAPAYFEKLLSHCR